MSFFHGFKNALLPSLAIWTLIYLILRGLIP